MLSPPSPPLSPPPPTSSSIIAGNDEVLSHLLICLPNKSLQRFRCVSKQWCSLISGNHFIQKRRSRKYRHRSINGLFLHRRLDPCSWDKTWKFDFISMDPNLSGNAMPSKTLSFTNDIGGIQIEQSCNGLLLCSTFKSLLYNSDTRRFDSNARSYYIYNPTTEQYTILPRFGRTSSYISVSLAFNPIKTPYYKVICMFKNGKDDYRISIYSSETCTWSVIAYPYALPNIRGSGVFWNGMLNWDNVGDSLVYFDIEREVFGTAPMPECFQLPRTSLYFGECKDHLYYIELSEHWLYSDPRIVIYEWHYGWRTLYNIDMGRLRELCLNKIGYNFSEFKVLVIDGEEKEEEYESPKLVLQIRDKVLSCDLEVLNNSNKHHDVEPPVIVRELSHHSRVLHAYQYIKSYASV